MEVVIEKYEVICKQFPLIIERALICTREAKWTLEKTSENRVRK